MPSFLERISGRFTNSATYELLPTNSQTAAAPTKPTSEPSEGPSPWNVCFYCSRPAKRLAALVVGVIVFLTFLVNYTRGRTVEFVEEAFPDYADVKDYERRLPQHDLDLKWPEGKDGRFVKFDVPYHHIGFNNQLQDILMSAEIAYLSNRAYVFQPYLWDINSAEPIVVDVDAVTPRSAIVPLNAFLAGPAAGGPMPQPKDASKTPSPRSISYDWFDQVCPDNRRVYVDVKEVRQKYGILEDDKPGGEKILEAWAEELGQRDESCIVVTGDHVWTFDAFGARVLSAWPLLKESPILTDFQWSPLVKGIVQRNMHLLSPSSSPSRWSWRPGSHANTTISDTPKSLSGLLAVHLRRGDFIGHCQFLGEWHARYNSWNAFESYVDKFPDPDSGVDAETMKKTYAQHCIPSVGQLVERLRVVRSEWDAAHGTKQQDGEKLIGSLKRVYVMTNAEEAYRTELKALLRADGWEAVSTSMDMEVRKAEVEVEMTADMMIGQLADVFVGNGFSSLTANINLLRMVGGVPIDSIRFL